MPSYFAPVTGFGNISIPIEGGAQRKVGGGDEEEEEDDKIVEV
jgi:hypothetical protein